MKEQRVNFESRSHPRYSVTLPVKYWPVDSFINHTGRTANVSENGLLIYAPARIEIGRNLRLKVFFSRNPSIDFIEALVEVVWKDNVLRTEGGYRIGAKYVGIPPEDVNKLKSFLNKLPSTQKYSD
jgi:hypothetical protein